MPSGLTLLELAAQGVEGLPPSGRWVFKPGFNVLIRAGGLAPWGLARAMLSLFFPESTPLRGEPTGRAGVTFLASDGATYRLVGRVGAEVMLGRLDPAVSKYSPAPIEQSLSKTLEALGLPERRLFEPLFLFEGPEEEDLGSAPGAPSMTTTSPGGARIESKFAELADQMSRPKARTGAELRQRLVEVEAELGASQELQEVQFRLDGLQQQLFHAEDAVKALDQMDRDLAECQAGLAAIPEVTEEHLAQLTRLPQGLQRRDEALKRIEEERSALEGAEGTSGGEPATLGSLSRQPRFVAAVSVGATAVVAAIVGSTLIPEARFLALLDVPFFGGATLIACRRLQKMRNHDAAARKLALLAERESRAQKQFEAESRSVQQLMKALEVEGPEGLEERLAARGKLLAQRDELLLKKQEAEKNESFRAAREARDQLRVEAADLEIRLSAFGGYRREPQDIQRELDKLRADLARSAGLGTGTSAADIELTLDGAPPPDEAAALLHRAGEAFAMTPAMLLQNIKDRAQQYISGLTEQRFLGLSFAPTGGINLLRSGGAPTPFAQIPDLDRQAFLVGLRLALAERYLSNHRLFLLFDERLDGLDAARLSLLTQMLKPLSKHGQVLWSGPGGSAAAEHRVEIA